MIAVIKKTATEAQLEQLMLRLREQGVVPQLSQGREYRVLGLIGDTGKLDMELLASLEIVESVKRVTEPCKESSRRFCEEDTVVQAGNGKLGGGHFAVIAGPCSVENEEQIVKIATEVRDAGATLLRGGAFKPRTSPYDFQGLGEEGLRLLTVAKKATGLPIVTEIMNIRHLDLFADVDIIQVGARNMQNYELLKELGKAEKPVLLKRGPAATLKELLMSAEYLMAEGNRKVILCERGIRSFDSYSRNTLDLTAVPALREMSHLPVIVDPSHATGKAHLVPPMALAAVACGADGVMIEVHNEPLCARCDGAQSLTPAAFADLMERIRLVRQVVEK